MSCIYAAQLKFWFQTDLGRKNSASYYRQGRQLLSTLLIMITRWSLSSSNFYAAIGQNLTGKFMRKIYAASWILFTLTAEADRVLCQLVMFLTVFFHWMYKMKFSRLLSGVFFYSWLVCLNPISDGKASIVKPVNKLYSLAYKVQQTFFVAAKISWIRRGTWYMLAP